MPAHDSSYERLADLARLCWRQAHLTQSHEVAQLLRKMAQEFRQAAANFDSGVLPDLGDDKDDRPRV